MKDNARTIRLARRHANKTLGELLALRKIIAKKNREAITFQKMAMAKKIEYEKRIKQLERDNGILRQSLKNFAMATNKQRRQLMNMKKHIKTKRYRYKTRKMNI